MVLPADLLVGAALLAAPALVVTAVVVIRNARRAQSSGLAQPGSPHYAARTASRASHSGASRDNDDARSPAAHASEESAS